MNKPELKFSKKDLLKRGVGLFFIIGIFFAISQDKVVLAYFLKIETIVQILFFTIFGGLFSYWFNNSIIRLINRKKAKNSEKKDNTDQTS
jgi:hypothetical protein